MLKKIFSFWILFLSLLSFSQSGFIGKTFYLDYNVGVSFTPTLPSYSRVGNGSDILSFYGLSHELSLHKIISRKNEISPYFNYNRSSFIDLTNKTYTSTYGVNFRFFFESIYSWNIAPLGNYFDLKPFVSSMKIKIHDNNENVPLYRLISPGLALGFGRQRIIQNRILFNYGIQFTLPFALLSSTNSYVIKAVNRNVFKTILEVKIGFGFLTF